jgi:MipA family protein
MKFGQCVAFGLTAALAAASPLAAHADDSGKGVQGYFMLGAGMAPEYDGADSYELVPYIEGLVAKGNYFLRFDSGALQVNLVNSGSFHAGPLVGVVQGRGAVESNPVSAMRNVAWSLAGGGFLEYQHNYADPRSGERLTVSAMQGAINGRTGLRVTARASANRPLEFANPGLIAALAVDVTWADNKYMNTFFSVDAADSAASGLAPFHAGSGIESAGVGFSLDQFLSRKWSVGMRLHYARLMGDASDSPVTSVAGSPNQFFGGLVLGYVL